MIEVRLAGTVASPPREHTSTGYRTKTCVRINAVDARGTVQWVDCRSTNPEVRKRLADLRVGDSVQVKGELAWAYYTKSDGRMQGLQCRLTVNVIRRLGGSPKPQLSKEAA